MDKNKRTIYTAENWREMDASFAELQQFITFAEHYGIPEGEERYYCRTVSKTFTIMLEIINNLRGGDAK